MSGCLLSCCFTTSQPPGSVPASSKTISFEWKRMKSIVRSEFKNISLNVLMLTVDVCDVFVSVFSSMYSMIVIAV